MAKSADVTAVKKKRGLYNFLVSPAELRAIKAAARKYTNGNTSEWLRLAGSSYTPG